MARLHGRLIAFIWILYFMILFLQLIDCSSKKTARQKQDVRTKKPTQDSDSDEDDTTPSPPQIIGLRGLTSAGIFFLRNSQSIPKCLGQDMRLEKLIQVTQFCEDDTGEGKNQSETSMTRSLCFTACMFKYMGLIGDDLMFTSNIGTVVVDIFPPIAHSMVKKAMRSCAKQSVLPLSKSDNCTSFASVKGCILRNVNNICNGDT